MNRVVFMIIASLNLCWAEFKHPVDFEGTYFKKSPYNKWMKDPFKNAPGFTKSDKEKKNWPKLDFIGSKNANPYVLLDGKRFNEGQFLDESRFISTIGENYVIITEGNFDYEIVMAPKSRDIASDQGAKK